MVMILIDIPEDLNHEVEMYKAKNGLSSKDDAIRYALSKYFHVKLKVLKEIYTEDEEIEIKGQ